MTFSIEAARYDIVFAMGTLPYVRASKAAGTRLATPLVALAVGACVPGMDVRSALEMDHDEAGRAWVCRYELAVVERGSEERTATDRRGARRDYEGGGHTVVESGDRTYEVWPEPADERAEGPHHWEIRREGAAPITVATNANTFLPPEVSTDGYGAFLVTWEEDDRSYPDRERRAIIEDDRVIELTLPAGSWRHPRLFRLVTGWLVMGESIGEGLVAFGVDAAGIVARRFGLGRSSEADPIVAEGHGTLAVVYRREEEGLTFTSADRTDVAVPIEDPERHGAGLYVQALVPAEDGWWLVLAASWQSHHFAYAPGENWFLRLGLDGSVLGRVHARLGPGSVAIEAAHAEGTSLRARYLADDETWRGLEVLPAPPCSPPSPGPCDPRRWARTPGASSDAESEWRGDYDHETHTRYVVARASDGTERWRTQVGGPVSIADLVEHAGRLDALTVGHGFAGVPGATDDVVIHTLDAETGRELAVVTLPVTRAETGCLAADGARLLVGVATDAGLHVFEHERSVWSADGDWAGCSLAMHGDRVVVAADRVEVHTSGGPITNVVVHVLGPDGSLLATHAEEGHGRVDDLLADEDGLWLTWVGLSGWDHRLLHFDREGTPSGPSRFLEMLYFFPSTRLAVTTLGPSLLWTDGVDEGVVPLCHALDPADAPSDPGFTGMGLTIYAH